MPGNNETRELVRSLVERLIQIGMNPHSIPVFVRFLARTIIEDPSLSAEKVNDRMRLCGASEQGINDEILRLTMACLTEISLRIPDCLAGKPIEVSHMMS
jgi:hypothetical protein